MLAITTPPHRTAAPTAKWTPRKTDSGAAVEMIR
jgi:hypothetical protein